MMILTDRSYFVSVSSSSTSTDTYTVPAGKKLYINSMGGAAVYNQDVKVEIFVNSALKFATHGDHVKSCDCIATAGQDVDIKLTNDSAQSETFGGYWEGRLYG